MVVGEEFQPPSDGCALSVHVQGGTVGESSETTRSSVPLEESDPLPHRDCAKSSLLALIVGDVKNPPEFGLGILPDSAIFLWHWLLHCDSKNVLLYLFLLYLFLLSLVLLSLVPLSLVFLYLALLYLAPKDKVIGEEDESTAGVFMSRTSCVTVLEWEM
jgi:hypothetical protein